MFRALIPFSLALLSTLNVVAEDQITLKNKNIFIGKVVALNDGIIELKTPHSASPLKVLNDGLLQLHFADTDQSELPKDSQILHLHNGDYFPGNITQLSETHLSFQTWFAGTLEVPRTMIQSLNFGMTPQRIIAQGPKNISDWTQGRNSSWEIENGIMSSSRDGFVGKDFALPESFIFGIHFNSNDSPNFRIHLCSDGLDETSKKNSDSYMIAINRNGIDVKRVIPAKSKGPSYRTLITHSSKLESARGKNTRLELRVNRKDRSIQLYLNGMKLEQGIDPSDPPSGTHVLFESLSSGRNSTMISNLIIQEWDASTRLNRLEPREADDLDTLSVEDGDRFSGQITGYDPDSPDHFFTVKSPLSPEPLQIPLAHCTVLYFTKADSSPPSKGQYQLDLRSGGQLTISDIGLGKEQLTATHPWLGDLQIDRRIMNSISKGK